MKLNLRYFLLLVIFINLLLLSSCFNKVQENQYIEINNIEILNHKNEKMIVEKHSDESIFFFDNNVQSNGIKKMTTPLPNPITYFYATTFTSETQFKFIVYGKCYDNSILKDINLNSYDLENNYTKINYLSKEIVTDGSNFIITFIVKAPKMSMKYFFSDIMLETNGKEKKGYENGPNTYASESYGIFLKYSLVETEFEKTVNTINETITTEFKLCADITKIYQDIKNNDYSAGYFISSNYWLCDIKYKDENIDNTTFTNYEHVCYGYSFLDNKFTEEKECYISKIYCNIEGYYLLGLSLNSSIEEVTTKMEELGLYEQTIELSNEVTKYYYNYDYGYITFYYNSKELKIESFMIDVHVDPSKYSS